MSDSETRAPIKAEVKVSPLIELSNGSLYPYWDLKEGGLTPYLNAIRRSFSFLNPFAEQQVPTSERQAFGIRDGHRFYNEEVFLNLYSLIQAQLPLIITSQPIMILLRMKDLSQLMVQLTHTPRLHQLLKKLSQDFAKDKSPLTKDVWSLTMKELTSAEKSKKVLLLSAPAGPSII